MRTAVEAVKLSAGFFIIPFMMAYSGLLMIDGVSLSEGLWSVLVTAGLIAVVAFVAEGYASVPTTRVERALFALSAVMLAYPDTGSRTLGLALGLAVFAANASRGKAAPSQANPQSSAASNRPHAAP